MVACLEQCVGALLIDRSNGLHCDVVECGDVFRPHCPIGIDLLLDLFRWQFALVRRCFPSLCNVASRNQEKVCCFDDGDRIVAHRFPVFVGLGHYVLNALRRNSRCHRSPQLIRARHDDMAHHFLNGKSRLVVRRRCSGFCCLSIAAGEYQDRQDRK